MPLVWGCRVRGRPRLALRGRRSKREGELAEGRRRDSACFTLVLRVCVHAMGSTLSRSFAG